MTDAAQREYAEALDAYNAALVRLREAKRHFDPKTTPEAIARTRAMAAANRAAKKAARNTPEARAERARWRQERVQEMMCWYQQQANTAQAAVERRENMPDVLRIITRVGDRK